jgi:hypothetical protein
VGRARRGSRREGIRAVEDDMRVRVSGGRADRIACVDASDHETPAPIARVDGDGAAAVWCHCRLVPPMTRDPAAIGVQEIHHTYVLRTNPP